MLTVWLPVAPEHHAATTEHHAGRMVQLFSQKCTLRGITSQWDADYTFTTGLDISLTMPTSHGSRLHPSFVLLFASSQARSAQQVESRQLSLNHSQETWPIRQNSVIYVQIWQATFLFLPPALQGGTREERTVFLCSLVSGWWFPPSLLRHCNFTLLPATSTILLPVIPLGQSFQGSFQKLAPPCSSLFWSL